MSRAHKILLFYAIALAAAADLHAFAGRLFLAAPDAVAWDKLLLALVLQASAIGMSALYLQWLGRTGRRLLPQRRSPFTLDLNLVPLIAAGFVAGLSVAILSNAVNCGSHPFPAQRGQAVCPPSPSLHASRETR